MKSFIRNELSFPLIEQCSITERPIESLDNITLFRFAHMHRDPNAGGMESYLNTLNRRLLERNRIRILQMYLAPEKEAKRVEIEQHGKGELIWIPSVLKVNSIANMSCAKRFWTALRIRRPSQFVINHDLLLSALVNHKPNLGVFHWISRDSKIIVHHLDKEEIPFVVINHFQNTRLKRPSIRRQIYKAKAIGGVSAVDVPGFVASRFTNLSDGVDSDFFHADKAKPIQRNIQKPLVFLPSRISKSKGHLDAVRALGLLVRMGMCATLAFAGRVETSTFLQELKQLIVAEGLQERVIFAGQLCYQELRNWYANSDLVVFPSYSEGLGRVLLEAQAMERPVVAYSVGGVPEALHHGIGGYLVEKGDVQMLAQKLKELLQNHETRKELAHRGRKFVLSHFSIESIALRHELFYTKALTASAKNLTLS